MVLQEQVVLITGASRGFGRAAAEGYVLSQLTSPMRLGVRSRTPPS